MKNLLFIGLVCCSFVAKARPNLILNSSFELNNSTECINNFIFINEYNTTVQYSIDYGSNSSNGGTLVLMKGYCLYCQPPVLFGGGVQDGDYMLAMLGEKKVLSGGSIAQKQGRISLELTVPLNNGQNYKLSFWIKKPPPGPSDCTYTKNNYISVGISNTDDAFGSHLITTNYGDTIWQEYIYIFETQMAEEHITVKVGVNDTIDYSVFIDNFVLTETTEPLTTGVNELYSNNKHLVKIVDILGKESQPNKKGLLFYIYSDGTVEKKLIIE